MTADSGSTTSAPWRRSELSPDRPLVQVDMSEMIQPGGVEWPERATPALADFEPPRAVA